MVDIETARRVAKQLGHELSSTGPALMAAMDRVGAEIKAESAPAHKLSGAQRWALLAAFNGDNTDWVHGNTINSLLRRGLIQWIDNGNAYENGRGGYIATAAGQKLAKALETAA